MLCDLGTLVKRVTVAGLLATTLALVVATPAATGAAGVPAPSVSGPIGSSVPPGSAVRDYPYSTTVDDLKQYGYVEEEFFLEGTANRYTTPPGATGVIVDGGHRYKTRMMVRRPLSPAAFNGTAIVEWNNVTPGHDLDIDWLQLHDYWMRSGYVWVGVSAQRVGVDALKVWSARRYGSLDVTDGERLPTTICRTTCSPRRRRRCDRLTEPVWWAACVCSGFSLRGTRSRPRGWRRM